MMDRIALDDTRFIYGTNFSGDPRRDTYNDDRRKANIVIPSAEQAKEMTKAGYKVKSTKPRKDDPNPEDFVPEYYVVAQLKYRKKDQTPVKFPPNVYLVPGPGAEPVPLTEDTVGCLDQIRVKNVNAILNPYEYDPDNHGVTLYIRTMYVEQDISDDPYAARYGRQQEVEPEEEPW